MSKHSPYIHLKRALYLRKVLREYNARHKTKVSSQRLTLLVFIQHYVNPSIGQICTVVSWKYWQSYHKPYLLDNNLITEHPVSKTKITYTITPDGIQLLSDINYKLAYSRLSKRKNVR